MLINLSCGSKPIDPRTAIPADALVYLETNDLGRALSAITENEAFKAAAKTVPNFSALNRMRVSVAVTGFQTSEEAVSEENAVLNFKPRFVAVAETNAWNYQALSFTENKLGEFVNGIYGGEVLLETVDKHGGKYFTWTANDGRKAYALVRGSLIFFGNDETAIDNCVNVMNDGGESIVKNPKVSSFAPDSLASGYVSKDGVAQIANIAAVSLAIGAGEESEVKSFIARVVPEIVRNTVTEVTWTSSRLESGRIRDIYSIGVDSEAAQLLISVGPGEADWDLNRFVPADFASTTRYNLADFRGVWQTALLIARTKTDPVKGGLLTTFASALLEPYGIEKAEPFLRAVGTSIQTVKFDPEGEEVAVITRIKNFDALKQAIQRGFDLSRPPEKIENADLWRNTDGELAIAVVENRVVVGERTSVERCLKARNAGHSFASLPDGAGLDGYVMHGQGIVATYGINSDTEAKLISVLSELKKTDELSRHSYTVLTRISQEGIQRWEESEYGLIGRMIEQLDPD